MLPPAFCYFPAACPQTEVLARKVRFNSYRLFSP